MKREPVTLSQPVIRFVGGERIMTHWSSKRGMLLMSLLCALLCLSACQSGEAANTPAAAPAVTSPVASQVAGTPAVTSAASLPAVLPSATSPARTPAGSTSAPTPVITTQATKGPAIIDLAFGAGSFNFPDTRAGLAALTSYKATLILSFDGTRDGKSQKWSKTYVMLSAKQPAVLQLTITKTGDLSNLDPIIMAESDGVYFERRGENECTAAAIEAGNSLRDRLEPAGFLSFIMGAEEAGKETVNAVAANHYTFDERASGQAGVVKSTGALWVASEGGYIVRYELATKGDAAYFGEGIAGTLTLDYQLTDAGRPLAVALPKGCPSGMVHAPLLPDASNVQNIPGLLTYSTNTSLANAAAFYQQKLPASGWELSPFPLIDENTVVLDFTNADQQLSVLIVSEEGTTVQIAVKPLP
jgi:hypothetical protein